MKIGPKVTALARHGAGVPAKQQVAATDGGLQDQMDSTLVNCALSLLPDFPVENTIHMRHCEEFSYQLYLKKISHNCSKVKKTEIK